MPRRFSSPEEERRAYARAAGEWDDSFLWAPPGWVLGALALLGGAGLAVLWWQFQWLELLLADGWATLVVSSCSLVLVGLPGVRFRDRPTVRPGKGEPGRGRRDRRRRFRLVAPGAYQRLGSAWLNRLAVADAVCSAVMVVASVQFARRSVPLPVPLGALALVCLGVAVPLWFRRFNLTAQWMRGHSSLPWARAMGVISCAVLGTVAVVYGAGMAYLSFIQEATVPRIEAVAEAFRGLEGPVGGYSLETADQIDGLERRIAFARDALAQLPPTRVWALVALTDLEASRKLRDKASALLDAVCGAVETAPRLALGIDPYPWKDGRFVEDEDFRRQVEVERAFWHLVRDTLREVGPQPVQAWLSRVGVGDSPMEGYAESYTGRMTRLFGVADEFRRGTAVPEALALDEILGDIGLDLGPAPYPRALLNTYRTMEAASGLGMVLGDGFTAATLPRLAQEGEAADGIYRDQLHCLEQSLEPGEGGGRPTFRYRCRFFTWPALDEAPRLLFRMYAVYQVEEGKTSSLLELYYQFPAEEDDRRALVTQVANAFRSAGVDVLTDKDFRRGEVRWRTGEGLARVLRLSHPPHTAASAKRARRGVSLINVRLEPTAPGGRR